MEKQLYAVIIVFTAHDISQRQMRNYQLLQNYGTE